MSSMSDIVNQPKLRKLKAMALTHGATGLVKSGKPGVLLYEMDSGKAGLAKFLEGVRVSLSSRSWQDDYATGPGDRSPTEADPLPNMNLIPKSFRA